MTPQNSAEQVSLLSVSSSPHVRSEDNVRGIMLDEIGRASWRVRV